MPRRDQRMTGDTPVGDPAIRAHEPRAARPKSRTDLVAITCDRCVRTSSDAAWPWWSIRAEDGRRVIVCDDCHRVEDDAGITI